MVSLLSNCLNYIFNRLFFFSRKDPPSIFSVIRRRWFFVFIYIELEFVKQRRIVWLIVRYAALFERCLRLFRPILDGAWTTFNHRSYRSSRQNSCSQFFFNPSPRRFRNFREFSLILHRLLQDMGNLRDQEKGRKIAF